MECQEFIRRLEEMEVEGPELSLSADLEQHQAECEDCHDRLQKSSDAWLLLPAALEKAPVSATFEANVMDRVTTTRQVVADSESADSRGFAFGKYVLAASILIALLAGTMWAPRWFGLTDPTASRDLDRVKEFARQMGKLDQLERTFAAPEVRFISLRTAGAADRVQGYLLYDLVANEGHYFGYNLVPMPGRTYKLWLLAADKTVINSAIVDVNHDNLGAAIIGLPDDFHELSEVVVTIESDAESVAPSSAIRMKARVSR